MALFCCAVFFLVNGVLFVRIFVRRLVFLSGDAACDASSSPSFVDEMSAAECSCSLSYVSCSAVAASAQGHDVGSAYLTLE